MNKLIIDKENNIDIKNNVIELDIEVKELTINIEGRVLINEITKKDSEELNLIINIKPNSELVYNRFIIHNTMNNKFIINQENNSSMRFNYSIIANNKCKLDFDSNINGDNNKTEIYVRAVTQDTGSVNIKQTADTKPKIKDNNLLESIKVLLLNDEESVIEPNLLVSSNEIEVNHAATLSSIDKDYLFYLNSKGISNDKAKELIKEGFLLSNLDITKEQREQIKELI